MLTNEDKLWIRTLIAKPPEFPVEKMQELKDSVFVSLEHSLKKYVNFQLDAKLLMEVLGLKRSDFFPLDFNEELNLEIKNRLLTRLPPALQDYIDNHIEEIKGSIDRYIDGLIEDWTKEKLVPTIKKKIAKVIDKTEFNINVSSSDIDEWD